MDGPAAIDSYSLPSVFWQSPNLRFRIVLAYWVVILLGLPLWWITTSIERLPLPAERVISTVAGKEILFPVDLTIEDQNITGLSGFAGKVTALLDNDRAVNPTAWEGLELHVHKTPIAEARKTMYTLRVHLDHFSSQDQSKFWITDRTLHVNYNPSNEDASFLATVSAEVLADLLAPYSTSLRRPRVQERLVTRYSSKFRLAYSLLNEDASEDDVILGWEQRNAISLYIAPVLSQLGVLYNFTVESQVQFHAPLAFEPPQALSTTGQSHFVLREEELKMFINSAEWTLASIVSEDPVLHFILFSPSPSHRPMVVQESAGTFNSFVVPQWGSVIILDSSKINGTNGIQLSLDHLQDIFKLFRLQLLMLLGVPTLPPTISYIPRNGKISEWQLDALLRRRSIENIRDSKEVLSSIIKLVDQITGMPVGGDVRDDVQGALDAIDQASNSISEDPWISLQHSARANSLSSRAFFNPGMLAMLYFPPEHRFAVYLPLFGPISLPLLVTFLREIRRRRKERQEKKEKTE